MKKHFAYVAAAALFFLASCGGSKAESEENNEAMDDNVEMIGEDEIMGEMTNEEYTDEELPASEMNATEETAAETAVDTSKVADALKEYKGLVDELTSSISKIKSGSIDVSTAMGLLDKAKTLQSSLEGMKSVMTAAQFQELSQLTSKLTSLASQVTSAVNVDDVKKKVTDKIDEKIKDFDPSSILK